MSDRNPAREGYIAALEEIAAYLRTHPEMPLPYLGCVPGVEARHAVSDPIVAEDQKAELARIARAMADGGRVHKSISTSGDRFRIWRRFGGEHGIALVFTADRDQVCQRVVVGTETVEVEEDACPECRGPLVVEVGEVQCAADMHHYRVLQPAKRLATTQREIVEWRCDPLLAGQEEVPR